MSAQRGWLLLLVAGCGAAFGHDVITTKITWSREVARIVYRHCADCHREGGPAFSLIHYDESRPWAKAIKEEVLERRMPPWNAVKGFGDFANDRGLTQEDLEIISNWVEGGAPEGDPGLLPPAPKAGTAAAAQVAVHGAEIVVDGRLVLDHAVTLAAIRAKSMLKGSSIQVIAQRPDGRIDPLLWIYNYQPKWDQTYVYRSPLRLPKGTILQASPAASGTVALVTGAAVSAKRTGGR